MWKMIFFYDELFFWRIFLINFLKNFIAEFFCRIFLAIFFDKSFILSGQIVITLPWKSWQCMMWFDWSKWIMWKMKKISYPKFIIHLLLIYYGFTRTKICSTCYSHMSVVANYFHICEGYYRLHGWLAWFMVIWKLEPIILQKCVTFSTSNFTTYLKRWRGTFGNSLGALT